MRRSNKRSKLAYSTEVAVCRRCGAELGSCRCMAEEARVPDVITAKLRIEKSGRGGKTVTVVYDLPRNKAFLTSLAKELKTQCGSGGKAGDGIVEVQGNHLDKLRTVLQAKGYRVKG